MVDHGGEGRGAVAAAEGVDDHAVVREGLKMYLALNEQFEIVGEGINGEQAVELVEQVQPDVVLIDLLMPGMGGVTAIGIIKQRFPDVELIALTSVLEDSAVVGAVRAGAIGYLLKDTELPDLVQAIPVDCDCPCGRHVLFLPYLIEL